MANKLKTVEVWVVTIENVETRRTRDTDICETEEIALATVNGYNAFYQAQGYKMRAYYDNKTLKRRTGYARSFPTI